MAGRRNTLQERADGRGESRSGNAVEGAAAPSRQATVALRIAQDMGLLAGSKSKHLNAKVPPRLFDAAARRIGTTSPAAVIGAALASLATEDELGPWLAAHWGALSDLPAALLDEMKPQRR